jgi:hypothetical protein
LFEHPNYAKPFRGRLDRLQACFGQTYRGSVEDKRVYTLRRRNVKKGMRVGIHTSFASRRGASSADLRFRSAVRRVGPGKKPRTLESTSALLGAEKRFQAVILSPSLVILSEAKDLALPAQDKLREESRPARARRTSAPEKPLI